MKHAIRSLTDIVLERFPLYAPRTCIGTHTYGVLRQRVDTWTSCFQALGVRPRHRVMMIPHKSMDTAAILLATWKTGGIAVPVPTFRHDLIHRVKPFLLCTPNDMVQTPSVDRIEVDADPSSTTLTTVDPPEVDSPALILFTSGTTAAPKGVVLGHHALWTNLQHIDTLFDRHLSPNDASFSLLPWYHCYGLVNELLYFLYKGMPISVPSTDHPPQMFREMRSHHPSVLFTVPKVNNTEG